jgi:hypothetical protein
MNNPAIEQDSVYVDKVLHFLALVLSPPIPFTNRGVEQQEFAKMLLATSTGQDSTLSEEQQQTRFKVISILASQNSDIANLVLQGLSA